ILIWHRVGLQSVLNEQPKTAQKSTLIHNLKDLPIPLFHNVCYTNMKFLFVMALAKVTFMLKINTSLFVRIQWKKKHALVMKYVSVWGNDINNNDNINDNEVNKLKKPKKLNNYNQWIPLHCFVSKPENGTQNEMLLFCRYTGLSIKYGEDNNTLQFHKLFFGYTIADLFQYAYVCINDAIWFFGGWNGSVYVRLSF
ncbi:hypothetical protein RFI_35425, partial [Reticulomyxa filosa]